MYDVASTILQQKLSQVDGVGQVIVGGSSLPAVRVELNPTALASTGSASRTCASALAATNVSRPKGQLTDGDRTWEIGANDQLRHADSTVPLIVAYQGGSAVRLSDVARVEDSVEDMRNAGLVEREAGGADHHVPPARREHHRDRRSGPEPAAAAPRLHSERHPAVDRGGPDGDDPRLAARRRADARRGHRAGGPGRLRVPPQRAGNAHPERRGPGVAHRHVRGDVSARATVSTTSR